MKYLYRFVIISLILIPTLSYSQLNIANGTTSEIWIAIGYLENGKWYSQGWWEVKLGKKIQVYGKRLTNRFYYIYAYQSGFGSASWKGDSSFCAPNDVFLLNYQNCSESNKRGFREIDVGNATNYTVSLTVTASSGGILPDIQSVRN